MITIKDPNSGSFAEIMPELGSILTKLHLKNTDVIVCPVHGDDYKHGFPSAFMFPFPSRIEHGKYEFEGKSYQFPINEPARGHAIHGFTSHLPFEVNNKTENTISCTLKYEGDYEGYPFPFEVEVQYEILNHCLYITYLAKNTGESNMPCAMGWHPYFKLGDTKVDDLTINIPAVKVIKLDEGMIARGEEDSDLGKTIDLKDKVLDNGFRVIEKGDSVQTELISKDKKLVVWQEQGDEKFKYLVIYTPPTRDCVAIEPLTSNINAFNNKEGLITLKPSASMTQRIKVWVE